MSHQSRSSHHRFLAYLTELNHRRKTGRSKVVVSAHGTHERPISTERSFLTLLKCFLGLLYGQRLRISVALLTLTVSTVLKLFPPAATKIAIDYVFADRPLPADLPQWLPLPTGREQLLVALAVAVVLITITESGIHVWGRWLATKATKRVQMTVRKRVFEHAVRLPLSRVYQLKSGGAASLLREDAGGVAELIFSMLYNPWRASIQLVGSLAVLAWIDSRLLLGSIMLLPLVFFTHRTWISQIRPLQRDIRKRRQEIDSQATEAFGGMRVVRAFGRQRSETGRFMLGNHLMARQELLAWWRTRTIEVIWGILIPLASAALLVYGGLNVLRGQLTLGDLMMFLFYLAMLLEPVAMLANSATQFQGSLAGLDRVLDLLEEPREMLPRPDSISIDPATIAGQITLRNVSFHYPDTTKLVLRDINLEIQPGQTVALVGPSGAGKTTLCNLIARFFDPTQGAIMLDGVDLRDIHVDGYRGLISIVEQDVFLFDGTVAENIGYGARDATLDEIRRAAQIANADRFISSLQHGYETIVGERGVRLSGGQRQRLAIARAVIADPRIVILDEATSNLDTESERLIQQSFQTVLKGRSCIVIAHRLSTIVHADQIFVLEDGRIVESGTHEELTRLSSRYDEMIRVQLGTHTSNS